MNQRPQSIAEATVLANRLSGQTPFTLDPIDVRLINGTGGSLAVGDLVMLDSSVVSAVDGSYTTVIAPTVAGNLAAAGFFHFICQDVLAIGATGRFRLYGDTSANLNANSGANALISSRGTNKDMSTTMVTLTKVMGKTKVTGTGVKQIFFDGRPPGIAIAP